MILQDFIVLTKTGLYCPYGDFYIDPKIPVSHAVISHAHGDHAISGNKNVYCTMATSLFMLVRYKRFAAETFSLFDYNAKFKIGEITISFHAAGHILGSAQVLFEYKGIKYLYTGDYKLEADESCEPFVFLKADVLITETTFADPLTCHPDAGLETEKLNETTSNIMLGAYALGKSQRMIKLINKHCPQKNILLHHNILPLTRVYESQGINLGKYSMYDRKAMKQNTENQIYIVPPMVFNSYIRAINVKRVFVTGWKHLQQQNDMQLYISDHADWNAILTTIAATEPTEVWTLHGDGLQLKAYLKGKIEVKILN